MDSDPETSNIKARKEYLLMPFSWGLKTLVITWSGWQCGVILFQGVNGFDHSNGYNSKTPASSGTSGSVIRFKLVPWPRRVSL